MPVLHSQGPEKPQAGIAVQPEEVVEGLSICSWSEKTSCTRQSVSTAVKCCQSRWKIVESELLEHVRQFKCDEEDTTDAKSQFVLQCM